MTARLRLFRVIVLEFRGHKKNSLLNVIPCHIVLDHTFISLLQSSSYHSRSACCLFPPPTSPPSSDRAVTTGIGHCGQLQGGQWRSSQAEQVFEH